MKRIIDELYAGQFCPESYLDRTEDYQRMHKQLGIYNDAFEDSLTPEQLRMFETLMDETYDLTGLLSIQKFYIGFCMGARLMMEVLQFDPS